MEAQVDFQQELQKLTINGLQELGKWIEGAKEFAVEQMPLFVQEYVKWYFISNLVVLLMLLASVGIFIFAATLIAKYCFERSDSFYKKAETMPVATSDQRDMRSNTNSLGAACFVSGVLLRYGGAAIAFICFVCSVGYIKDTAKAVWAPRVVVVEGIKDIIKAAPTNRH